jgi:hypothetical protein
MQIFKYVHLLVCAVAMAVCSMNLNASGTSVYVAQTAGVFSGGSACNGKSAESIATFNAGTEAAGNTYYFCGTITTTVKINGSGTSGNVITFKWDTGARISQPVAQAINLNGASSFLLFDGGTPCGPGTACDTVEAANLTGYAGGQTGIIEATANGSGLASQSITSQVFYNCQGCHDIEIRNLIIRNLYIHSSTTDTTPGADTGNFVFQCPGGSAKACAGGVLSIHDCTLHDDSNAVSFEKTSSTVTLNIYNNDFYRDNWAIEMSGSGPRIVNFYSNHIHDAANWDTTNDFYHHNGMHIYMTNASDSLGINIYNNLSDGNWGSCCTTATQLFTDYYSGYTMPNNLNVYNNVSIQYPGNLAPAWDYAPTTGVFANNTAIGVATTPSNTTPIQLAGTGITFENNTIQGYGQYVVVQSGTTFANLNYDIYGPIGKSGNTPWSWDSKGESTFAAWQSASSGDANGRTSSSLSINSIGQPQSGSVLINNGANLSSICGGQPNPGLGALCSDLNNNVRPSSGAWTAGAYNSTSTGPAAPTGVTGVVTQ